MNGWMDGLEMQYQVWSELLTGDRYQGGGVCLAPLWLLQDLLKQVLFHQKSEKVLSAFLQEPYLAGECLRDNPVQYYPFKHSVSTRKCQFSQNNSIESFCTCVFQ